MVPSLDLKGYQLKYLSILFISLLVAGQSLAVSITNLPGGGGGTASTLTNDIPCADAEIMVWESDAPARWVCAANASGGASTALGYVTKTAEASLSNEFALGSLTTGLLINTTTTGIPTILAAQACTNQFVRGYSASGTATCESIADADVPDTVTVTGWTLGASVANTAAVDTNTTALATTAFVQAETIGAGVISGTLGGMTVDDGEIVENDLAASLAFDDADLLNFAAVSVTTATEGIIVPQHATTCAAATADGQLCWEVDAAHLWIGDGATALDLGPGVTAFTSFNVDGDNNSPQTVSNGNELQVNGGTNGIDTAAAATNAVTVNMDYTEISTATFGAAGAWTWTFNTGTTDPAIDFGDGFLRMDTVPVRVGDAGTIGTATGDGDLYVEDALEVDGAASVVGAVTTSSTLTIGGALDGATTIDADGAVTGVSFTADDPGDGERAITYTQNTAALGVPAAGTCDLGFVGTALYKHCASGSLTQIDSTTVVRSIYIASPLITGDGAVCGSNSAELVSGGPIATAWACGDSAFGALYFNFVMPDSWNASTFTVEIQGFTLDATISGGSDDTIAFDISCMNRRDGDAINSSFGSAVAADLTFVTQYVEEHTTSAAITPNGTLAAGAAIYCRAALDAITTDTNTNDMRILGFKVEYTANALSD